MQVNIVISIDLHYIVTFIFFIRLTFYIFYYSLPLICYCFNYSFSHLLYFFHVFLLNCIIIIDFIFDLRVNQYFYRSFVILSIKKLI